MASLSNLCPYVKCLIGYNADWDVHRVTKIRCRRWTCRWCAKINLRHLLAKIRFGQPNKLITLTSRIIPGRDPAAAYNTDRPKIRRLIQLIRRTGNPFECVIICEKTDRGYPHWHLVAKCNYIPQHWLSDQWKALTGSFVVDIRKIKSPRHAANYVAKYVTKNIGHNRPPWMKRVVQFTRGYQRPPKWRPPPGWTYWREQKSCDEWIARATQHDRTAIATDWGWLLHRTGDEPPLCFFDANPIYCPRAPPPDQPGLIPTTLPNCTTPQPQRI